MRAACMSKMEATVALDVRQDVFQCQAQWSCAASQINQIGINHHVWPQGLEAGSNNQADDDNAENPSAGGKSSAATSTAIPQ